MQKCDRTSHAQKRAARTHIPHTFQNGFRTHAPLQLIPCKICCLFWSGQKGFQYKRKGQIEVQENTLSSLTKPSTNFLKIIFSVAGILNHQGISRELKQNFWKLKARNFASVTTLLQACFNKNPLLCAKKGKEMNRLCCRLPDNYENMAIILSSRLKRQVLSCLAFIRSNCRSPVIKWGAR